MASLALHMNDRDHYCQIFLKEFFIKEVMKNMLDNIKKPHIHAELIKAWADGARIEKYIYDDDRWDIDYYPQWFGHTFYRIKPEPKPDIVVFRKAELNQCTWVENQENNLMLTFDGETGELKAAEVVK